MRAHVSRFEAFLGAVRDECRERPDHFLHAATPDLLQTRRVPRVGNAALCEAVLQVYDRFDHRRWVREGSVPSDVSRLVWRAYRTGSASNMGPVRRHLPLLGRRAVYGGVPLFDADPARIRAGSAPTARQEVHSVAAALDGELQYQAEAHVVARLGGDPVACVYVAVPGCVEQHAFVALEGYPLMRPFPRSVRVLRVDGEMVTTGLVVRVEFDGDGEREYECPLAVESDCVSSARVARDGAVAVAYSCR